MKNVSLIINIVLAAAVAFLYFHVFSKPATPKTSVVKTSDSAFARAPIAYVELDSLNERIDYIKNKRKELEAEQKAIETEWEGGMRGLQQQRDKFLARGASITQAEAEKFQEQLYTKQQQIESKKQNSSQKLSEKSYKFMDDIQTRLKSFLKDYNKEKNYMYILTSGTGLDYMIYRDSTLNITDDVVAGMNEIMKAK